MDLFDLFARRLVAPLISATCICAFAGCSGSTGASQPPPGKFVTLNQHCYVEGFNGFALQNLDIPELQTKMAGAGWTLTESVEDNPNCQGSSQGYTAEPAVLASMFGDSAAENADFVWFSGHGDAGVVALYQYNTDHPGDCSSQNPNAQCFWGISSINPSAEGNLKWVFAVASQSTSNNYWIYAFNQTRRGLHGYYGIEGEPSEGLDGSRGRALADEFVDRAIGAGGKATESVHSAWRHAAGIFNVSAGEWELKDALGELLTSGQGSSNGVFSSTNPLIYTDNANAGNGGVQVTLSLSALNSTSPGNYSPRVLQTENYSDQTLAQQADMREPGSYKYYASPNQYRILSSSYSGSHYEGSQGVIASSEDSSLPYNYTQQDALSFALSSMQQNNPLPADAQLQFAGPVYETTTGQAPVVVGYDFVWIHNDLTLGGDFIRVGVDNKKQRVCVQPNENDPPYNKPPCLQWQYQYNQHLNFYYRLWRQPSGSVRYPLGVTPGSAAISPAQAYALSQPAVTAKGNPLGSLLGYVYSYWTPDITSTDNTAYPSYHFVFSNHYVVSVDAFTGGVYDINAFVQ